MPDHPSISYHYASPNFNERPDGDLGEIKAIVLHYTDTVNLKETMDILVSAERKVSAHYVLDVDGTIYELVPPDKRAWHAGVSCWHDTDNLNDFSIGIEIQNGGHRHFKEHGTFPAYPDIQIASLIELLTYLCSAYQIDPQNIIAHSDVAPERKLDPGEHFPWDVLGDAGFGLWPAPEVDFNNILLLQYQLKELGYTIPTHGQMDDQTWVVIDSFKRHFYPKLL